jgi:NAD(P)-dependent dehydrogenase (short-subunit alcohol dehydrogenase family)
MLAPSVLRNHSRFRFHHDDPCLESRAEDIVAACQEGFGAHIDILLNIPTLSSMASLNNGLWRQDWDQTIAQTLTAPALLCGAVVEVFQAQQDGGTIVNVFRRPRMGASVATPASAASTHGLIGLTKDIAVRFRSSSIRCNAVYFDGMHSPKRPIGLSH